MSGDAVTAAIGAVRAVGLIGSAGTEAAVADFVFERRAGEVVVCRVGVISSRKSHFALLKRDVRQNAERYG